MLEKPESWCSQQFVACKKKVVASKGFGAHKNDNVQKIKTTYHINKKRFSPFMGFLRNIYLCIVHVCESVVTMLKQLYPFLNSLQNSQ